MSNIPRGTTPTFTFTFTEQTLDLTQAANVYVTFSQGMRILTKTGEDLEVAEKSVSVYLTQKETLAFSGNVEVQVNWTTGNKDRAASDIVLVDFSKQLLNKEVE